MKQGLLCLITKPTIPTSITNKPRPPKLLKPLLQSQMRRRSNTISTAFPIRLLQTPALKPQTNGTIPLAITLPLTAVQRMIRELSLRGRSSNTITSPISIHTHSTPKL